MALFGIAGILIGSMIGFSRPFTGLIPALLFTIIVAGGHSLVDTAGPTLIQVICLLISLQVGYLVGAALSATLAGARVSKSRSIAVARRSAE